MSSNVCRKLASFFLNQIRIVNPIWFCAAAMSYTYLMKEIQKILES
ncbi:hypothetical protein [Paenibacillus glucanolyticus]